MRRVEAETPMQQSLQYQYEQAVLFWLTKLESVTTEQEWAVFMDMVMELGERLREKEGTTVTPRVLNGIKPADVDSAMHSGAKIEESKRCEQNVHSKSSTSAASRVCDNPAVSGEQDIPEPLVENSQTVPVNPAENQVIQNPEPVEEKEPASTQCPDSSADSKPEARFRAPDNGSDVDSERAPSVYDNKDFQVEQIPSGQIVSAQQLGNIGRKVIGYKPYRPV